MRSAEREVKGESGQEAGGAHGTALGGAQRRKTVGRGDEGRV